MDVGDYRRVALAELTAASADASSRAVGPSSLLSTVVRDIKTSDLRFDVSLPGQPDADWVQAVAERVADIVFAQCEADLRNAWQAHASIAARLVAALAEARESSRERVLEWLALDLERLDRDVNG